MKIEGIHHVSLLVRDLERARAFYRDVVGLEEMERPNFDFPGAWFRVGEAGQQLHLIVHPGETLWEGGLDTRDGHFAARISDFDGMIARLEEKGVPYRANRRSTAGFAQIFVLDPDRNIIEFNAEWEDEKILLEYVSIVCENVTITRLRKCHFCGFSKPPFRWLGLSLNLCYSGIALDSKPSSTDGWRRVCADARNSPFLLVWPCV